MTNHIDEIMRLALAYRMADTVDLWPTECDLRKAVEAALKPGLPDGWVPCTITYEGQYPEEVAYGPQRLMDRLKKWLDRYFAMRAEQAALKPGEHVYAFRKKGLDDYCTCDARRYLELKNKPHAFEVTIFYRAAPPAQTCHCKDRPASECPGEWEPGCDMGSNEAYAVAASKSAESAQYSAQMASAWAKVQTNAASNVGKYHITASPENRVFEQEPVDYRYKYLNFMGHEVWSYDLPTGQGSKVLEVQALYTSPPRREPVPPDGWLQEGSLLYRLTDESKPQNRDEINVTMADGSRSEASRTRRAGELLDRIRERREPLTQTAVVDAFCKLPHQVQYVSVFLSGVRFAEKHHGIKP